MLNSTRPLTDAERRDRVAEMKQMIQGQIGLQRFYLSIKQDPGRTQREIDRINNSIAKMTRDRDALQAGLDDHKELYIQACERAEELQQEILLLENQSKIDKLMELTRQLNTGIA